MIADYESFQRWLSDKLLEAGNSLEKIDDYLEKDLGDSELIDLITDWVSISPPLTED